MKRFLTTLFVSVMAGCSDAGYAQLSSLGEPANVICYSGVKEIYRGRSTGKLMTEQGSDGWFFQEVGSGHLVRVSGSCVVRQKTGSSVPLPPIAHPDGGAE